MKSDEKKFNESEYKVAGWLALGYTTKEIYEKTDISPIKLRLLRNNPAFVFLIRRLREDLHNLVLLETSEVIQLDIRKFEAENKVIADELLLTGKASLRLTRECIEKTTPDDISPTNIPALSKSTIEILKLWEEKTSKNLQINELMKMTGEFNEVLQEHHIERKLAD